MPKYRVKPNPFLNDGEVRDYDLAIVEGDIVTVAQTTPDTDGDVFARRTHDNRGDWINPECLEVIKNWQDYTPDGLTPVEGDEVVGKLYFQNDEIVKGVVTGLEPAQQDDDLPAGAYITVSDGPEGNIGDQGRFVHQTRILKSAQKEATEGDVALADWEHELLTAAAADGRFVLVLTEEELRYLASDPDRGQPSFGIAAKAQALLPKPKTATLEGVPEADLDYILSHSWMVSAELFDIARKAKDSL
jgi:hypothetical protein